MIKTGQHGRPFQLRDRVAIGTVTNEPGEDKEALKARQKRELRAHKGDEEELKLLKGQHKKALDELNDKENKAQESIATFFDEVAARYARNT